MPGGKCVGGRTEGVIEVIFPVVVEMTIVAAVCLLPMTARDEARTVTSASSGDVGLSAGDGASVA